MRKTATMNDVRDCATADSIVSRKDIDSLAFSVRSPNRCRLSVRQDSSGVPLSLYVSSTASIAIPHIINISTCIEMLWIAARRVIAVVQYQRLRFRRPSSVGDTPSYSVYFQLLLSSVQSAVAPGISQFCPRPASGRASRFIQSPIKALFKRKSVWSTPERAAVNVLSIPVTKAVAFCAVRSCTSFNSTDRLRHSTILQHIRDVMQAHDKQRQRPDRTGGMKWNRLRSTVQN